MTASSSSSTAAVFGLHVGNTNACIAVNRDGRSEVVANPSGDRVTPAAVGWRQNGEGRGGVEVLTGLSARQMAFRFPQAVVGGGNQRVLAAAAQDVKVHGEKESGPKLILEGERVRYEVLPEEADKAKSISPEEVHTHILKYMHDIALSQLSGDGELEESSTDSRLSCVLTVPATFGATRRSAAAACAEEAGFSVAQVISQDAAAVLAHGVGQRESLDDDGSTQTVVVFRAGGRTVSCSVAEVTQGIVRILATREAANVGAEVLRNSLAEFLADEFKRKYKIDPRDSRRAMAKLRRESESVMRVLSTLDSAPVHVESLMDGLDFGSTVNRARFDAEVAGKAVADFVAPVHEALKEAGVAPELVHKLVLCGGATKVARIRKAVTAVIPKATVLSHPNADETLAVGASLQASLLLSSSKAKSLRNAESNTEPLTALNGSVIFTASGGPEELLLAAGTLIPARKSSHVDLQGGPGGRATVSVSFAKDVSSSGRVLLAKLELPTAEDHGEASTSPSSSRALLSLHAHRDGSMHITLSDKSTARTDHKILQLKDRAKVDN